VTTPAKGRRRLLLVPADRPRSVADVIAWLEWTGEDDVRRIGVALARGHYLRALSARDRRVLESLTKIRMDDTTALQAWAARWPFALPEWAIGWARQSIRLARGRYWCPPNDDEKGALVKTPAPAKRPRTARAIADVAPLLHAETFAWLARYQLGGDRGSYLRIAKDMGTSAGNVRRDCRKLALLINLPLRPTRPGQPRKKVRSRPN
jgi:hypothetical protein